MTFPKLQKVTTVREVCLYLQLLLLLFVVLIISESYFSLAKRTSDFRLMRFLIPAVGQVSVICLLHDFLIRKSLEKKRFHKYYAET